MRAELTITRLGRQGEGVALHQGEPIYVPFALPGERLIGDIDQGRASIVELLQKSDLRVDPFCKHFGSCGGCSLQHVRQTEYQAWKRNLVVEALRREGLAPPVKDMVIAHGEGRRRATLHARASGVGFNAARSHQVHALDHCPILIPALAAAPQIGEAVFRSVGDSDVTLTATGTGIDCAVKAQKHAKGERLVPVAEKFDLARMAMNGDIIVTRRPPQVRFGTAIVDLPPGGFLQATALAEETLAGLVMAASTKARRIADLFCGLGPFALRLAAGAAITAIDSDAKAAGALQKAARHTQGLKPVHVQTRDLFREPLTAAELGAFDLVVIDPPRAGAEAQSRQVAKSRLQRLVYVSCDPVTFARDAKILCGAGFNLSEVTPVDQFAWSRHVELVAAFSR